VAILTIYHNLQYHRLIWFHNQKYKATAPSRSPTVREGSGTSGIEASHSHPSRSPTVREGSSATADLHNNYGAAELISRRLLYYVGFGIIFGLIYQGPRQILGYLSLKNGDGVAGAQSFATQLGISFLWGYAFIHYYLDSKIWRVRRDPAVGKALNMG
jgi:hypothetical protein